MCKAEKFISEHARNCSNEIAHWDIGGENVKPIYSPWLTPDQAREAVEIAREEMLKVPLTDKEKLEKIKKLADAMYYAAQQMTTDASRLHKAMEGYHQFIINEYHKEG